jgi:hypothetical protein
MKKLSEIELDSREQIKEAHLTANEWFSVEGGVNADDSTCAFWACIYRSYINPVQNICSEERNRQAIDKEL